MPTIYSGDTWPFTATLKVGAVIFPILITPTPDTVTALFVDPKTKVPITADITCLNTDPGADWANGKVAIVLPSIESVKLEPYATKSVLLVVQVSRTGYGKKEWQTSYTIQKGWIA
jgi:hypothetical protein